MKTCAKFEGFALKYFCDIECRGMGQKQRREEVKVIYHQHNLITDRKNNVPLFVLKIHDVTLFVLKLHPSVFVTQGGVYLAQTKQARGSRKGEMRAHYSLLHFTKN